jgi:hypothetical protein
MLDIYEIECINKEIRNDLKQRLSFKTNKLKTYYYINETIRDFWKNQYPINGLCYKLMNGGIIYKPKN